jgi:hypothetical protein
MESDDIECLSLGKALEQMEEVAELLNTKKKEFEALQVVRTIGNSLIGHTEDFAVSGRILLKEGLNFFIKKKGFKLIF